MDTGLDSLIDLNGYYKVQRECDTTFFSVFMFYPDGLFVIATGTDLSEVTKCFEENTKSTICDYPSWGIYKLEGDTIKTQAIILEGMTSINVFRDYLIKPNGSLVNISDYVQPEKSNVGYLKNYPSFKNNPCFEEAIFYPLKTKKDPSTSRLFKQKWFKKK